jgi:hypothetical protein
VWTNVSNTSGFEGYCGMLMFFGFMPIGMVLGGRGGAGYAAARDRKSGAPG